MPVSKLNKTKQNNQSATCNTVYDLFIRSCSTIIFIMNIISISRNLEVNLHTPATDIRHCPGPATRSQPGTNQ